MILFLVSLLTLSMFNAKSQVDTTIVFENQDKKVRLFQKELGEQQSLIINTNNNVVLKQFQLDKREIDPFHIADYFKGERNFVVIKGRYQFYILIVSTNHLIGPFRGCPRFQAVDAQTGILGAFKIIQNGQYLLVGSFDNGAYCFDLRDLYNPKEIQYTQSQKSGFKTKYLFIDNRRQNIYNGILASYENYKNYVEYKVLFHGYSFVQTKNGELKKNTNSDGLVILEKIQSDKNVIEFKIDLKKEVMHKN